MVPSPNPGLRNYNVRRNNVGIPKFIVIAAVVAAPLGIAATVSASAENVVNKGACVRISDSPQIEATLNGPLTISANGALHTAKGHTGGAGCAVK